MPARRDQLCQIIQRLLPAREETPATAKIHAFLRDLIQLDTDVSALMGHARNMVTRVSGGLAHWARRLEFEPFRLRITGTAGSGKTQLALAEYRATLEAGKRPLYVCFNRPLADHFNRIAPSGGLACTYHQLCDQRVRHAGETPDFTLPDAFERLQKRAAELPVAAPPSCSTRSSSTKARTSPRSGATSSSAMPGPMRACCGWKTRCRTSTGARRHPCPAG